MLGWVSSPARDSSGVRVGALRLQVCWEAKAGGYASYVFGHRLRHVLDSLEGAQAYAMGIAVTELERARTDLVDLREEYERKAKSAAKAQAKG